MGPIALAPHYISPVWGGPRIAQARGLAWTEHNTLGESFDVSAHPGVEATVASGPCAGMPFGDFLHAHRDEVLGDVPEDQTIQIVSMDARQNLSVQVHPAEADAWRMEGDHGKVEAWYVLAASEGATLIAGCSTSDTHALRAAAADDTIGTRFGERVAVAEGDFVLIPPGTLHALGAGIFAVEVGSLGNTTYRLCDWGRGRELHVDKGFAVLDCSSKPTVNHLGAYRTPTRNRTSPGTRSDFFAVTVADVADRMEFACNGRYAVVTCVGGSARVGVAEGSALLQYTESCVIPAAAHTYSVTGPCRALISVRTTTSTVPEEHL